MKIIIGDSNLKIRQGLKDFLTKQGHEVLLPETCMELINLAQTTQAGFVFLDAYFTGANCLDLLRRIADLNAHVGIVLMGDSTAVELAEEASLLGAMGFIQKDLLPEDFFKKVSAKIASTAPVENTPKAKILVVDDDASISQMLSIYLTRKGYEPHTAANGEEALTKIRAGDFQLVLMVYVMPGLNGLETFQKIKEIKPDLAVIMVTVITEEKIWKKARELGAYDYLVKPVNLKYLDLVLATKLILM